MAADDGTDHVEPVAALERFVVDNEALLELEARIGRFNVFDALGVVRQEIRHSTFLRWLLDPNESHGQGALFLRAVLMDVLRHTPAELRPLSPIDLDGVELRGVDVRTEWNRVDVLITSEEPAFVVAIENKVDSSEHGDQLSRYHKVVGRHFGDRRSLFVYLTREGDEPSHEGWTAYSYRRVHDVLVRVMRMNEGAIGDDVRVFLEHYVSLLRGRFMDDPEIDGLVAKIYKQHRQAIDLIFERRGDPRKCAALRFADLLEESVMDWRVHVTGYACQFFPAEWERFVPPVAKGMAISDRALLFGGVRADPNRLEFNVSIAPATDPEVRSRLVDLIAERGSDFELSVPKNPTDQWTRIRKKMRFPIDEEGFDGAKACAWMGRVRSNAEEMFRGLTPILRDHFESQHPA
mgnify:CR=1 FL=1